MRDFSYNSVLFLAVLAGCKFLLDVFFGHYVETFSLASAVIGTLFFWLLIVVWEPDVPKWHVGLAVAMVFLSGGFLSVPFMAVYLIQIVMIAVFLSAWMLRRHAYFEESVEDAVYGEDIGFVDTWLKGLYQESRTGNASGELFLKGGFSYYDVIAVLQKHNIAYSFTPPIR